ncbi:hypothetical protein FA95DRAFT_812729 [Auriscalpium vulgare]|uniref:Uncharacterized protein n=1 Tax=Auriscalpium vulgare TaxID=40419 RepID=A0ACB8R9P9_9AGAM|nr:hypothetical protein FA95DRAFT_812729 [Auriscalpium vulgare]
MGNVWGLRRVCLAVGSRGWGAGAGWQVRVGGAKALCGAGRGAAGGRGWAGAKRRTQARASETASRSFPASAVVTPSRRLLGAFPATGTGPHLSARPSQKSSRVAVAAPAWCADPAQAATVCAGLPAPGRRGPSPDPASESRPRAASLSPQSAATPSTPSPSPQLRRIPPHGILRLAFVFVDPSSVPFRPRPTQTPSSLTRQHPRCCPQAPPRIPRSTGSLPRPTFAHPGPSGPLVVAGNLLLRHTSQQSRRRCSRHAAVSPRSGGLHDVPGSSPYVSGCAEACYKRRLTCLFSPSTSPSPHHLQLVRPRLRVPPSVPSSTSAGATEGPRVLRLDLPRPPRSPSWRP